MKKGKLYCVFMMRDIKEKVPDTMNTKLFAYKGKQASKKKKSLQQPLSVCVRACECECVRECV